ncbi:MAG: RlmE family RNA methyltransferase [Magnetococcales bacterium]|nr:RlmE family RNA methyltransferase [Magnetococcales bacterium]
MGRSSSPQWLREHAADPYVRAAQRDGYRSRAAYKLLDLQRSVSDRNGVVQPLLRAGMAVLDLGAAPGGWSQVAAQLIGPSGLLLAVDLLPIAPISGATILQGDFLQESTLAWIHTHLNQRGYKGVDVLLSDMAPNLSGIRAADQARTAQLVEDLLALTPTLVRPGGSLVVKLFQGSDSQALLQQARQLFRQIKLVKPDASRDRSAEHYLVGIQFRESNGIQIGPST